MTESDSIRYPVRRAVLGPVTVTAALVAPALAVTVLAGSAGWVLAWLLLGLTAGYALSGSV